MKNNKKFSKSLSHFKKVKRLIPNQSQTLSKAPAMFVPGQMPLFSKKAKGCYVWDIDGNKFIDYIGALGPILLGYGHSVTDNAVKRQLKDGMIFSQPHMLEAEVAELLTKVIPSAEMVRFAKNGSDVTAGAVRIARAYTGKYIILYCGYHGAQDWYVVTTERNYGVPKVLKKLVYGFKYNNIKSLEKLFKQHKNKVAAVIMEPTYYWLPKNNFLKKVKTLTHKNKALLIFDEVITGFRWHLGGAQKLYGVTPDLSCFGKSMANGMPISAVVGKREIMQKCEKVFFSMCYGGDCLSLSAAKANIEYLRAKPEILKHIWKMGALMQNSVRKMIKKHCLQKYVSCYGSPPRWLIDFTRENGDDWHELKTLLQQYMVNQGVLAVPAYWNMTYSHKLPQVKQTLLALDRSFGFIKDDIKKGLVDKKSSAAKPVFSRKI